MSGMNGSDAKDDLQRYLQQSRDVLMWKLDGLSEYDIRRPLTSTGANLLGLVKHLIGVEAGYLGHTFGRPFSEPLPWLASDEPNVDMWATPDESRDYVVGLYRRVCAHSDATIDTLDLDSPGAVAPWPADRRDVTLHRILVHVIAETARHAGHADIVRELIDGSAGLRAGVGNLPDVDADWWRSYRDRVEQAADTAR